MKFTKQRVGLIEYAVFNHPEGMEGWRFYRIEYGGHAENCLMEKHIWLPPMYNAQDFEDDVNSCQKVEFD